MRSVDQGGQGVALPANRSLPVEVGCRGPALCWHGYSWCSYTPLCVLQTKDAPGSDEEEEDEERPSMDLFKAVFASSSDEKSSSSSSEEEEADDEEDKDEGERLAGAGSLFNITPSVKSTTPSTAAVPPGNDSLSKGKDSNPSCSRRCDRALF